MNVKLIPFQTPNFVRAEIPVRLRQEGLTESPAWPLSEVDAESLAKLCDDFRAEIFRKAAKGDPAKRPIGMKTGIELIAAERDRQTQREGYTSAHDDTHRAGEIAMAAVCYTLPSSVRENPPLFQSLPFFARFWPWESDCWKPSPNDRRRELAKAGALISAEIDRLNRLAQPQPKQPDRK